MKKIARRLLLVSLAAALCWAGTLGCGSDNRSGSDSDSDSDSDADECADYRTVYPEAPYGTAVGDVIANYEGMVDGEGNPHDFFEIFQDRSVVALVIANAFDT